MANAHNFKLILLICQRYKIPKQYGADTFPYHLGVTARNVSEFPRGSRLIREPWAKPGSSCRALLPLRDGQTVLWHYLRLCLQ